MKIIIHVGMPKTGSSSIQQTFAGLQHPELEYVDWIPSGNHSALFVLLFHDLDKLSEYHGFKARGAAFIQTLPALRADWHARVSQQLARTGDKTVIFSAEAISRKDVEYARRRLRDFFAGWSDDISVIGYVRPPAGFAPSAFQQRLKGGMIKNPCRGGVSPNYRRRFETFDRIFGRDAVNLREFSSDRLLGGDVVQDFAHQIGVGPLAEDQNLRANESLSLEAVALLYAQRKLGQGFVAGFDRAHVANNSFVSGLATIGRRKFGFSQKLLAPLLEKGRDDIAWMEKRLGHSFSEPGAANPDAIDSLDDLVDIALGQFDAVQDLLGEDAVDGPVTTENLVRGLERLRERYYEKAAAAYQAAQSSRKKGNSAMVNRADRAEPSEEELRLRGILARILWHIDHQDDMPSDPAERKAAFEPVNREYQKKAHYLTRHLRNNNLMIGETVSRE
ncbi:MAG: hypothetical protein ACK5MY_13915 [Jhaorihella sp.]